MFSGRLAAPGWRGSRRAAAVLAGLAIGTLATFATPMAAAQAAPDTPLTAADKNLLNGVRLAGLWEMPAGNMAAEKGGRVRVRQVGAEIAKQHAQLDKLVVDAANKLNYRLPDEPNSDQQKWLAEMEEAKAGADFDQVFVDRLRAAHGKIFPVIGGVRSGTRNDIVRKLAQDANGFVLTHLTLLESTGLVKYSELPLPPDPPQAANVAGNGILSGAEARSQIGGVDPAVIWVVLLAALVAGGATTFRLFRSGR
jgi:predicted outer membrane protein